MSLITNVGKYVCFSSFAFKRRLKASGRCGASRLRSLGGSAFGDSKLPLSLMYFGSIAAYFSYPRELELILALL